MRERGRSRRIEGRRETRRGGRERGVEEIRGVREEEGMVINVDFLKIVFTTNLNP